MPTVSQERLKKNYVAPVIKGLTCSYSRLVHKKRRTEAPVNSNDPVPNTNLVFFAANGRKYIDDIFCAELPNIPGDKNIYGRA